MDAAAFGWLATAVALPTALGFAVVAAVRVHRWREAHRPPLTEHRPIERVAADLRRLHALLDATENSPDLPAKYLRCKAVRAAYVDALTAACRALEVAPPAGRPVPQAEIYRVESDLRRRGLDARPAG